MNTSPRHLGIIVFALAAPACAELSNVFASSFIFAETSIEHEGVSDKGPDFQLPFFLNDLGTINESRQTTATIPTGSTLATAEVAASFSQDTEHFMFDIASSTHASLSAGANDTFSFVKSRVATLIRFTTDEAVRATITGDAALSFDFNNLFSPLVPQTIIEIIPESGGGSPPPAFQVLEIEDEFAFEVILQPGAYQFRASADTTFQTFGFPENLYTADSELNLALLIAPVPAPSAALLFPLAAAFSSRRRHLRN